MNTLAGKTALATGASRGIGRATALALAKARAQVLVHYSKGEQAAADVVAEIRARLDILIANAGVSKAVSIEGTTVEDFDNLFAVNVRAPFFLVQQLLPAICKRSTVALLSSLAARTSVGTLSAYAATKGAIDTLVTHFAADLGKRGIRVNAVAPGVVGTDMSNFAKTTQVETSRSACKLCSVWHNPTTSRKQWFFLPPMPRAG